MEAGEAEPLDIGSQAEPRNQFYSLSTRYQALPGNADPEALPPIFMEAGEAEPLDIGSQAEPRTQLSKKTTLSPLQFSHQSTRTTRATAATYPHPAAKNPAR